MTPPLVSSDGFACGALWVPPFRLARGECLQIVAPSYGDSLMIGAALAAPPAGVQVAGRVQFARRAWDPRGRFARLFRPAPTAAGWLVRMAAISAGEAVALLGEFGFDLDPQTRLGRLPGNYRAILGLAAAWARRPDVLVFTAAATDWTGRQWLARQITARLDHWAVIELSGPYFSQGRDHIDPPLLPGASSVSAEARAVGMSA
jgi:hypothetical protein